MKEQIINEFWMSCSTIIKHTSLQKLQVLRTRLVKYGLSSTDIRKTLRNQLEDDLTLLNEQDINLLYKEIDKMSKQI